MTGLCIGERPSTIYLGLTENNTVCSIIIPLPHHTDTNVLTVNTTLTVLEDNRYTAVLSFSNLAGEFSNSSTVHFCKNISILSNYVNLSNFYSYFRQHVHVYIFMYDETFNIRWDLQSILCLFLYHNVHVY